jgi:hypothetical protein
VAQIHNDQQVYALLGRLFESVVADEEIGPRLHAVDAVVQQQFRRPDATVTMKLIAGEDREVITGDTDLRAEVLLVMDAVTGHRVWLGEVSAMAALSKGQIRARGPVAKILRLIDLVALVAPRYREQLDALAAPGGGLPPGETEAAADEAEGETQGSNGEVVTAQSAEEPEAAAEESEAPAAEPDTAPEESEAPAEPEAAAEESEAPAEPETAAEESEAPAEPDAAADDDKAA